VSAEAIALFTQAAMKMGNNAQSRDITQRNTKSYAWHSANQTLWAFHDNIWVPIQRVRYDNIEKHSRA